MTIYLVQILIIGFLGIIIRPDKTLLRRKRFIYLSFIILALVSSIRAYSVGADTSDYVWMFNYYESQPGHYTRIEWGFLLYLKILKLISSNPQIMLIASSIICIGIACFIIYKLSPNPVMSMILYILMGLYFSQMNTMRQSLAISFTSIAFYLILEYERKAKPLIISILIMLLAVSFHTIAVVAFIPYFIILVKIKQDPITEQTVGKLISRAIIVALLCFAGYPLVLQITLELFPSYSGYFSGTWSDANYFGSLFNTLIILAFAVAGAIVFRKRIPDKKQYLSIIMISFALIFYFLSMRMEIWNRVASMFDMFIFLIWVPEFTASINSKSNKRIVNTTIYAFALAYMLIVLIFRPEWTSVVPYITIFE